MHRKVAVALVAALALVAAGGCGGGSDSLSRAELAQRADAICRRAQSRAQTLMRQLATSARGRRVDFNDLRPQIATLLQDLADDLDGLSPPDELKDEMDEFVSIMSDRADAMRAGREVDETGANRRSASLARTLGFRFCG